MNKIVRELKLDIKEGDVLLINNNLLTLDKVFIAEECMKQMPQLDLEVKHHFSHGVYARELFIPKDTILVGKLHKYPQLNILSKGDISVLVDDEIIRLKAPQTICSPAGVKRIAYAHEDTVWLTIHGTNETNVDKIEQYFIAQTEQDYIEFCEKEKNNKYIDGVKQLELELGKEAKVFDNGIKDTLDIFDNLNKFGLQTITY